MLTGLFAVTAWPALPAQAADDGLVLHYPCDEADGDTLTDASGAGNNGTLRGPTRVRFGDGWALQFDGADDAVACGRPEDLDLREAVSLEAWVCATALPAGEAGIVGKDYGSFVLTHYRDGCCWWYISGGGNNCRAPLTLNAWHHVVGTFDGATLKLYLDGALADSRASATREIAPGGVFWLGKSDGDRQFTQGAHFAGLLDEVRAYRRALTADEVQDHYRTTHLTHALAVTCRPYPYLNRLTVRLDARGLGEIPPNAQAHLSIRRLEAAKPLLEQSLGPLMPWGEASFDLDLPAPRPGEYEVLVQSPGAPAATRFIWPASRRSANGSRRLNNLVTELLDLDNPGRGPWSFMNPGEGWVLLRLAGAGDGRLVLDGPDGTDVVALLERENETTQEAMRRLPAGRHTLRLDPAAAGLSQLTIRAIPELIFAKFGAHPHVREYGDYDWEFLGRHVLPHLNTMVGNGAEDQRPFAQEWKRDRKRWIVECMAFGLGKNEPVSPDEAEASWAGNPGMKDPLLDGLIVDEFWSGDLPQYAGWTEAVRRLAGSPALAEKLYYPYCGSMYGSEASREFMRAVLGAGNRFALERYLPEPRTAEAAEACLDSALSQEVAQWEAGLPGSPERMVVCFGYFSAPPESLDVDPTVDHKVWLDMQFHRVANDPAFDRVAGLMTYLCSYADEETVRWAARLFRHYGIEGRADRLTTDPYKLPHVANPDFEDGLTGWDVEAAEEGAVSTSSLSGFSWLQGRYPRTSQGDTFAVLRRSAQGPNRLSQTVRSLTPGRLYSLRCYSADIGNLGQEQKLGLSLQLTGADVLPDQQFQHVFPNCYSHHLAPYDDKARAWMNYHWLVFRATGTEARLAIADWTPAGTPGGPPGQSLAVNFVQVQPYEP